MNNIRCPVCGSKDHTLVLDKFNHYAGVAIARCNNCGHRYSIVPADIDKEELYKGGIYKTFELRDSIYDKLLNAEYNNIIKKINYYCPGKGQLLDFGSGKGRFANLAQKNGWQVKAVETAAERADYAEKIYKLRVSRQLYSSGKIFDVDVDVITIFHVLEHLSEPAGLLEQLLSNNLKPGGLVVIEVPNVDSWQSFIAGKHWHHLDIPRHVNHFTPQSLELVLKKTGLFSIRSGYFSFHLGVLGMIDGLLKLFGYRGHIIYALKNKNVAIIGATIILFPVGFIIEVTASLFGKGGIIRKYARYNKG